MRRFIVASKNKGKLQEIKHILKDLDFQVLSMEEIGIDDDIDEYGSTFEENATIKAKAIFDKTGEIVLADDSGLEIDYLNKQPGIYSARFAGKNTTYKEKMNILLDKLKGVPLEKRTARFVCATTVYIDKETHFTVKGICEGAIAEKPAGENGFGYDPIFYLPERNQTTAQLSPEDKHSISHRGNALRMMVVELKKLLT